MQLKEKIIHHDIPIRPCDVVDADMFHINSKNYLCIMDYHSKFPVVQNMGYLCKIMSDAGGNFISENSKTTVIA